MKDGEILSVINPILRRTNLLRKGLMKYQIDLVTNYRNHPMPGMRNIQISFLIDGQ